MATAAALLLFTLLLLLLRTMTATTTAPHSRSRSFPYQGSQGGLILDFSTLHTMEYHIPHLKITTITKKTRGLPIINRLIKCNLHARNLSCDRMYLPLIRNR